MVNPNLTLYLTNTNPELNALTLGTATTLGNFRLVGEVAWPRAAARQPAHGLHPVAQKDPLGSQVTGFRGCAPLWRRGRCRGRGRDRPGRQRSGTPLLPDQKDSVGSRVTGFLGFGFGFPFAEAKPASFRMDAPRVMTEESSRSRTASPT